METVKIKVVEAAGTTLDWLVAKCEGATDLEFDSITWGFRLNGKLKVLAKGWAASMSFCPSTEWAQGGPIIDREGIEPSPAYVGHCARRSGARAYIYSDLHEGFYGNGETYLIAAMRCYVASKLGEYAEVPAELTQGA